MLKGIDINQRIEFISKEDNSEPKTILILRPLSSMEMLQFSSLNSNMSESLLFYMKKSIVEIKNNPFEDVDKFLESIESKVLGELLTELNRINNISDDEIKN